MYQTGELKSLDEERLIVFFLFSVFRPFGSFTHRVKWNLFSVALREERSSELQLSDDVVSERVD